MGIKTEPNYANLYMVHIEKNFIFNYPVQPLYYRRFIDDIFYYGQPTQQYPHHHKFTFEEPLFI